MKELGFIMLITSGENSKTILMGGHRLKRVPITIQYKNNPDFVVSGYALSHEILPNQVSFFATQKFPMEEELTVSFQVNGEKQSLTVLLKHMHEQISSGRIMNSIPSEENPFPARKFYRCYTQAVGAVAAAKTEETQAPADAVAAPVEVTATGEQTAPVEVAAQAETVEAAPAAPVVEMPVAKVDSSDIFGASAPVDVPIPVVDDEVKAA